MKQQTGFFSANGNNESFLALYSVPAATFECEAEELLIRYLEYITGSHAVLLRFHLSDIANQADILRNLLEKYRISNASLVGQTPVNGSKIALEAWLCAGEAAADSVHIVNFPFSGLAGSDKQMYHEFATLADALPAGQDIELNVVRTWIYCRDVDNNYAGLVKARKEFFNKIGLTEKTHYIASTGIEGQSAEPHRLVYMDSLVWPGIKREQIEYMQAIEYLSPTHIYGVTFERAVKITSGDRAHFFLSGTASIDKNGMIVHPGDVKAQTLRTLENMTALLENHGGKLADLKQAVVYLRDIADYETVKAVVEEKIGSHCAFLMVHAPVCRPGWLVEIEGIALNDKGNGECGTMK